mgnify:CR=1 FL=1
MLQFKTLARCSEPVKFAVVYVVSELYAMRSKLDAFCFLWRGVYGIVCHAVVDTSIFGYLMNQRSMRNWKVLCWNVRGLNSEPRQRSVREKISESQCAVACLQETKLSDCSRSLIKRICPVSFDQFIESPSRGASGGILTVWHSDVFKGG